MKMFKDDIPAPVGITAEEWEERKRKLKRKAWIRLFAIIIFQIVAIEFAVWMQGGYYDDAQPRSLEELQVKSGEFYYKYSRWGADTGIKNNMTGEIVLFDNWMIRFPDIKSLWGHPATVWYYVGQGERKYVYQLKVDDLFEYDIERVNQELEAYNNGHRRTYRWIRTFFILFLVIVVWFENREKYREWLLKNDK